MWGSGIRILGIDGGAENESACDTDDNDFDNDSDEDDDNETTLDQQNCKTLKSIFKHDLHNWW